MDDISGHSSITTVVPVLIDRQKHYDDGHIHRLAIMVMDMKVLSVTIIMTMSLTVLSLVC